MEVVFACQDLRPRLASTAKAEATQWKEFPVWCRKQKRALACFGMSVPMRRLVRKCLVVLCPDGFFKEEPSDVALQWV